MRSKSHDQITPSTAAPNLPPPVLRGRAGVGARRDQQERTDSSNLLPSTTLVLWLTCLIVGVRGLSLHYPWPKPPPREPTPAIAQRIQVQIANESIPAPQAGAPSSEVPTPAVPLPPVSPAAPPLPTAAPPLDSVAKLIAAPAFTIPGPTPNASPTPVGPRIPQTTAPPTPPQPTPTRLTYGVGEARQPAPEYPPEAQRAGEEGIVIVQFTVDGNGHVTNAEASTPSPWPSLNNAAVRAVRDTWRFPTGPSRNYEVVIQFELRK